MIVPIDLQKILFQLIRAVRGESPDHFATSGRSSQTPPILHRGVTIFLGKKIQIDTFQSGSRGGPIIMTQIENEFGNYGYGDHPRDKVSIFCLSFEFLLLYCRHISGSSNQCSGMRYNKCITNLISKSLPPRASNLSCSRLTPPR